MSQSEQLQLLAERLPGHELKQTAAALDGRLPMAVIAVALPVPLAIAFGMTHEALMPSVEYGVAGKNITYGVASLLIVIAVYAMLGRRERAAVFNFSRPSKAELTWVLLGFPIGSALFLGAQTATSLAGFTMDGYEYTLADPVTVGAVVFGAVLVAPIAEEVLFRGLLLGGLLGRGIHPVVAGGVTILAFGCIHLAVLGIAGVVATCAWAVVPTALRLRYDNLSGAWLIHQINNIWSYLIVVAIGL